MSASPYAPYFPLHGIPGDVPVKGGPGEYDYDWQSFFRSSRLETAAAYDLDADEWHKTGISLNIPGRLGGNWSTWIILRMDSDRGIDVRFAPQNAAGWASRMVQGTTVGYEMTPAVEVNGFAADGFTWLGVIPEWRFVYFPMLIYTNGTDEVIDVEYRSNTNSGAGSGARIGGGSGWWAHSAPFPP